MMMFETHCGVYDMFDFLSNLFSSKNDETYPAIVYYKHETARGIEDHVYSEEITVSSTDKEAALMDANYILNFEQEEAGIFKYITDIKFI